MLKPNETTDDRMRRILEMEKRERAAQLAALRQIRDNPEAPPKDRIEAVKLIEDLHGFFID